MSVAKFCRAIKNVTLSDYTC